MVVCFPDRNTAIKGIRINELYLVNVLEVFLTKLLREPVPMNIWHFCFEYIGIDAIRNMVRKGLVDELDVVRNYSLKSIYEDCVFGKIYNLLYDNDVVYEIRVMECIHIYLWGLSPITSASRSWYFILLIDGVSSFQTIEFLRKKSAKNTLRMLKTYIAKSEKQTG